MRRKIRREPELEAPALLPRTHAVVGQMLASFFSEVELSASLVDGTHWLPIHLAPSVNEFENAHGRVERWEIYNVRSMAKARRDGQPVLGEYAGFYDLFVPIGGAGKTWGVLVTGPFARARPTSSDLLSRWRWLTGNHGRPSDPEFSHYLALTLSTTIFDAPDLESFRSLLACFSQLLEGRGHAERLEAEVTALRAKLRHLKHPERMWEAARSMVDDKTWRRWLSQLSSFQLSEFGMKHAPQHVLVGLLLGRADEMDAVDDLLRRDAFQRACVELVKKRGGAICGRIGDHGIVLLMDDSSSGQRARVKLVELGDRVRGLARRYGLKLFLGASAGHDEKPLPRLYQAAFSAAEQALSENVSMLHAEREPRTGQFGALAQLRRQLTSTLGDPGLLAPRFDRYLEAVMVHCGHRFEPARAHLEAGFDQITDALRESIGLDERSLSDLSASLQRAAEQANTTGELSAAYRRAASDLQLAISHPKEARQDRSVRRAIAFIREHLAEPLGRTKVARVAGFAPGYFSKVFRHSERTTLQRYILALRLERAQSMLASTTLTAERVGQLCGFRSSNHFHRAFKQSLGITPLVYRSRGQPLRRGRRRGAFIT